MAKKQVKDLKLYDKVWVVDYEKIVEVKAQVISAEKLMFSNGAEYRMTQEDHTRFVLDVKMYGTTKQYYLEQMDALKVVKKQKEDAYQKALKGVGEALEYLNMKHEEVLKAENDLKEEQLKLTQ